MKLKSVKEINEEVALKGTLVFGSMWTCYAFFCYGFLPLIFPSHMDQLLYWSNTVQLWSLPLLMVGQVVMSRASEKRAQEDHETIMAEFAEVKAMHEETHAALENIQAIQAETKEMHTEIHQMVTEMHEVLQKLQS